MVTFLVVALLNFSKQTPATVQALEIPGVSYDLQTPPWFRYAAPGSGPLLLLWPAGAIERAPVGFSLAK